MGSGSARRKSYQRARAALVSPAGAPDSCPGPGRTVPSKGTAAASRSRRVGLARLSRRRPRGPRPNDVRRLAQELSGTEARHHRSRCLTALGGLARRSVRVRALTARLGRAAEWRERGAGPGDRWGLRGVCIRTTAASGGLPARGGSGPANVHKEWEATSRARAAPRRRAPETVVREAPAGPSAGRPHGSRASLTFSPTAAASIGNA
jgi:hypothetical protein